MDKKKIILLVVGVIAILGVIGGLLLWSSQIGQKKVVPVKTINQSTSSTAKFTESGCSAQSAGLERDVCYSNVAIDTKDPTLCNNIADASWKGSCVDITNSALAILKKNVDPCLVVADAAKFTCRSAVYRSLTSADDCSVMSEQYRIECRDRYLTENAKSETDCAQISKDSMKADCVSSFHVPSSSLDSDKDGIPNLTEVDYYHTDMLKTDTDGDGLSDHDEIFLYRTDPLNPDTDGDGFSDGAEVKLGYNPNGPGKISIIQPSP